MKFIKYLIYLCISINFVYLQNDIESIKNILDQNNISKDEVKQILKENSSNLDFQDQVLNPENTINKSDQNILNPEIDLIIDANKSLNSIQSEEKEIEQNNLDDDNYDTEISEQPQNSQAVVEISNYFGYSTFLSDPDIFQKSADISASPNYKIGPGDEIIIMLWGQTEDLSNYIVSRDGYIFIPNIGQVFVNGMTLEKLENRLKKILQKAYSSLSNESDNGTTFLDVSLGSAVLKPIRVFVMGEVSQPGAYEMKPSTSLFTSLYYFNGPKISGSLRDIRLIRNGKEISSVDFYDFLLTGKKLNDIQLQDDDVVFITNRQKTIKVKGEIKREAIYELKNNETFKDLLKISGGFLPTTYMKRARLDRIIDSYSREESGGDRRLIDLNLFNLEKKNEDLNLFNGDEISFYKISDFQIETVEIYGQVKRPGKFSITNGLKVLDLIKKADGLLSNDIYREKVELVRSLDGGKRELITVNLDSILANVPTHNIKLQTGDIVNIFSLSDRIHSSGVSIDGFVLNPGVKDFQEGMTIFDLLFMGGGFENNERLKKTYLPRAEYFSFDNFKMDYELISFRLDSVLSGNSFALRKLKMGDKIYIYSIDEVLGLDSEIVELVGYVKKPGIYTYAEGMTVSDLLFLGGGVLDKRFSKKTFKGRADIIRYDKSLVTEKIISISLDDLGDGKSSNIQLLPGDRLLIYSEEIFGVKPNTVSINGAINSPGDYEIFDNMVLGDLILLSGGLTQNFDTYKIEISNLVIAKESLDQKIAETISFEFINDSKKFLKFDDEALRYEIKRFDKIFVRSQIDRGFQSVTISGEINYPGEYILETKTDKLFSLVLRSGGLTQYANSDYAILVRKNDELRIRLKEVLKSKNSKFNLQLMNGDRIVIPSKTNLVTINGAVSAPGKYQLIKNYKLNDYIKLAGGYTEEAVKSKVFVTYPNGASKKNPLLGSSPKVLDESTITVPTKAEAEPFSMLAYATNLTQIYSDLLQAYALFSIIGRSN